MMSSDESNDDQEQEVTLFTKAIETVLEPYYYLTSPTAIKAYLSALLFLVASVGLLTVSTTAYLFFYYKFIPPINLERTLYLQYGVDKYPFASTDLDTSALISQQPYDVELVLQMPRTPTNLAAGNFMLDVQLLGPYDLPATPEKAPASVLGNLTLSSIPGLSVWHHSRRPAMLPYESTLLSLAHTSLYLPLHLIGFRNLNVDTLHIPMFELLSFPRGSSNIPTYARVEVQTDPAAGTGYSTSLLGAAMVPGLSTALQVYSARIHFAARFHGLRYIVYNFRILSFLTFTALFYTVCLFSLALAWAAISTFLVSSKDETSLIKRENGTMGKSDIRVKQELDDSDSGQGLSLSNVSDSPRQFPSSSTQAPIKYEGRGESSAAPRAEVPTLRPGEAADDEEGFDDDDLFPSGRSTSRYDIDSGIGTSMESGRDSTLSRRRSGRTSDDLQRG